VAVPFLELFCDAVSLRIIFFSLLSLKATDCSDWNSAVGCFRVPSSAVLHYRSICGARYRLADTFRPPR